MYAQIKSYQKKKLIKIIKTGPTVQFCKVTDLCMLRLYLSTLKCDTNVA